MNSTVCDSVNQLASLADAAATQAGANLGNYTGRVYSFPRNACTLVGFRHCRRRGVRRAAWVKGTYSLKVVGHELGHNFGDRHSNSCRARPAAARPANYGDDRDMMGAPAPAFHRVSEGTPRLAELRRFARDQQTLTPRREPTSSGNSHEGRCVSWSAQDPQVRHVRRTRLSTIWRRERSRTSTRRTHPRRSASHG